ncbi:MAG: cell division ATP-binding protein FtsE [Melioribacteraceae bacterium]|nr:cell division ATP-binding protein FtsE [Melioribacteraceae bacterium]MCF8354860.1 cell division ATP-binding protein FtsE [Melioribacteraceae bacterium]MCF8392967.1 cell division ATP-binding protein FtsE [Melioribacteraceae bacterium]MCF8417290.1 cell division ATP-binding protein FtsE [Melioribacteraceae bacterium]
MLLFDGVVYNYSNQPVFSDLNFELNEGEFSFLIGKSGAGKTTLMQLIYMNLFPQEGNVKVGEFNSKTIKEKEIPLLRRKLGIIFQDFKLLSDRNVYENLAFVLRVTGTPKKLIKRKVFHALSDVGLSNKQNNMPDELSGGEKQRVAIARAIINDPMLILADEPTGNLDPETSSEILDILIKINQRGTTLLLATHNYDLVKKIDAKIIKIADGKAVKVKLKR